ncbi:Tf2-6, partial [Mucuna pruriens]
MEVYVDDMVVKSSKEEIHYHTLERVFEILRRNQLRLNPEKCSFGVRAGKFLGFMLTERGIEANPDKCQASQCVKEVQQLMGKIAALSRFIPWSAETAQPIFGALRRGRFTWTNECEEAFQRLKTTLSAPLVLTQPTPGIPLHLYLAASKKAISAVLVQERDGEQHPHNCANGLANSVGARKTRLGRTNGGLEHTIVRIRHHFRKERPHKSTSYGRFPGRDDPGNRKRRRGRMVPLDGRLVQSHREQSQDHPRGPSGVLIEQSLHFEFKASNNQAEYEALLAGMKLAQELGMRKLTVKSDSKLITGQVNGEYQAKDPQLEKYRDKAAFMAASFDNFTLLHIPREQNEKADLLAKLASTQKRGQQKMMIHEKLSVPTIDRPEFLSVEDRKTTWMTPILDYLQSGTTPKNPKEALKIANEAAKYTILGQQLYRRDYFTKWVEAEPTAIITTERIKRFYWKRIICRFGLPVEIVSDNSTQFASKGTIKQSFTSVEHPQSNGQAEAANKVILRELCRRLEEAKGRWAEELPQVLWSYHTAPHSTTNETPFRLTFGMEAMIPVEIGEISPRTALFEPGKNEEELRANLDLIQEVKEIAHIREYAIKARATRRYNQKVIPRSFKPGDLVLKKITMATNRNKLTPCWEGPFRVIYELGQGAYKLESLERKQLPRTWNATSLRMYYS